MSLDEPESGEERLVPDASVVQDLGIRQHLDEGVVGRRVAKKAFAIGRCMIGRG
jgi:hypothetical protein